EHPSMPASMNDRLDRLENKISTLQRSNRRLCLVCAAVGLAAVSSFAAAAGDLRARVFDVITTEQLQVVGKDGKPLVSIGSDADGGTLFVQNAQGTTVFAAFSDDSGRGMTQLSNEQGDTRLTIGSDADGGQVSFFNTGGSRSGAMGVEADGSGYSAIYDAQGNPR